MKCATCHLKWRVATSASRVLMLSYLDNTDSGYDGGQALYDFFDNVKTSVAASSTCIGCWEQNAFF